MSKFPILTIHIAVFTLDKPAGKAPNFKSTEPIFGHFQSIVRLYILLLLKFHNYFKIDPLCQRGRPQNRANIYIYVENINCSSVGEGCYEVDIPAFVIVSRELLETFHSRIELWEVTREGTHQNRLNTEAVPKGTRQNLLNVEGIPQGARQNRLNREAVPKGTRQYRSNIEGIPEGTRQNGLNTETVPEGTRQNRLNIEAILEGTRQNRLNIEAIPEGTRQNRFNIATVPEGTRQNRSNIQAIPEGTRQNRSNIQAIPEGTRQNRSVVTHIDVFKLHQVVHGVTAVL